LCKRSARSLSVDRRGPALDFPILDAKDVLRMFQDSYVIEEKILRVERAGLSKLRFGVYTSLGFKVSAAKILAHLRFYGGAVLSARAVGSKTSKVPFDQIIPVAIGSAMALWNSSDIEIESTLLFLIAFADILDVSHQKRKHRIAWPKVLAEQPRKVQSADLLGRHDHVRFITLGRRRCGIF